LASDTNLFGVSPLLTMLVDSTPSERPAGDPILDRG
jgi:hypothetical protein